MGAQLGEIGVFVRGRPQLDRARSAIAAAGLEVREVGDPATDAGSAAQIGTMHLAKGIEFKAVAVMACDEDVLRLRQRVDTAADQADLDEIYDTERQLFYVACTRARDRLMVSGVAPASEFLEDLGRSHPV